MALLLTSSCGSVWQAHPAAHCTTSASVILSSSCLGSASFPPLPPPRPGLQHTRPPPAQLTVRAPNKAALEAQPFKRLYEAHWGPLIILQQVISHEEIHFSATQNRGRLKQKAGGVEKRSKDPLLFCLARIMSCSAHVLYTDNVRMIYGLNTSPSDSALLILYLENMTRASRSNRGLIRRPFMYLTYLTFQFFFNGL